jgi:phosphohistidine phosphatase
MKTIIATRHAKTLQAEFDQLDFERELAPRGFKDSETMAQRLLQRPVKIDGMLSSTAFRAKATCFIIANQINFDEDKIILDERLYNAPSYKIEDVLAETPDEINTLLFVAHNFGISDWVHQQIGNIMEAMPTGAMVAINIDTDTWANISTSKKTFLFYDFPKNGIS